jgi:hypothetical protein
MCAYEPCDHEIYFTFVMMWILCHFFLFSSQIARCFWHGGGVLNGGEPSCAFTKPIGLIIGKRRVNRFTLEIRIKVLQNII